MLEDLPSDLPTAAARFRWIVKADYADEGPLSRLSESALIAVAEALEAAADVAMYESSDSRWMRTLRDKLIAADRSC